jgi:rhamnose utilization protein RhaD (predicted bifunctional aldolase and dehydrogenase)/NAD(P)-dependent dehydrogenase (short-subunit alcohol dehydrogenase family)
VAGDDPVDQVVIEGETELERLVSRSRLIGADPTLVLHGGGNTSTKLVEADHLGVARRSLRIKGSGSDLATATTADFPGLWLDDLLPLRERDAMTDEEMVAYLGRCLVDPDSARPSIETLLHAFLPAAHVDHVHADAICSLANAPDPEAAVHEALGDDVAVVPYLRPGFELSCRVAELADARAVVLAHHGLVTWGDTHEASYELALELVGRAREYLGEAAPSPELPEPDGRVLESFLVRLRGRLSREQPVVLAAGRGQRSLADRPDVARIAARRSTPDHMLRIGARSCVVGLDADPGDVSESCRAMLVPGFGGVAAGPDARAARARLEIAAHTHASVAATLDRFGGASWLDDEEVRDFLEWPLELYKLTLLPRPPELAGRIVLVTGAASGIGRDVARDLAARGAHLVLADLDRKGLSATVEGLERAVAVDGDLCKPEVVDRAVHHAVASFGGLDAVVFSAGIAATGALETLADDEWRRALEVNLSSQFALTRRALALLREQGIGGSLVYVASKNAFAPGAGFGPYSVSKAGLVQLMRIAALEGGPHGIRANAVNPDAVFEGSKLWSDELRRERAEAHGIPIAEIEAFYASRSLLGRQVTGADVAEAVAFLVSDRSRATTGAVLPVDGGVAAAFPR